uniref:Uncharacterized protein n=1 Tax=Daphnia galeata TaxID=27404 RepID=A0A8J2RP17_9CRUS|nr:unnamed protein product [Daphnia galeata]
MKNISSRADIPPYAKTTRRVRQFLENVSGNFLKSLLGNRALHFCDCDTCHLHHNMSQGEQSKQKTNLPYKLMDEKRLDCAVGFHSSFSPKCRQEFRVALNIEKKKKRQHVIKCRTQKKENFDF